MLITLDIEDYYKNFCKVNLKKNVEFNNSFIEITENLSSTLKNKSIKCVFFILGEIVLQFPELIKKIVDDGHEIGCHGYSHSVINKFNKIQFKNDLMKCQKALNKISSSLRINYYRSPIFSMLKNPQDYYDVLSEFDVKYSSSFTSREFIKIKNNINFNKIKELPINSFNIFNFDFKFTGGSYFRITPFFLLKILINNCIKNNIDLVFYFHPYDFYNKQNLDPFVYSNSSKYKHLYFYFKNIFYNYNLKNNNIKFNKFLISYIKYIK